MNEPKFKSEFEKNVYLMRKYQKTFFETRTRDSLNMAKIYEKKVDEHFQDQQSLFKT